MLKIHNILLLLLAFFIGALLGALTAFFQPIALGKYYAPLISSAEELLILPSLLPVGGVLGAVGATFMAYWAQKVRAEDEGFWLLFVLAGGILLPALVVHAFFLL